MTKPILVLLHGWGNDSRSWQPIMAELGAVAELMLLDLPGFGAAPALPEFTLDAVLENLASQLPSTCVLMGWSLGGMLAIQLAARYPQQVSGVITLTANAKFVAADDYPCAMPLAVNQHFNAHFAQDAVAALKLFTGLLAQGDEQERPLLKQLRQLSHAPINANWLQALELLATLDNRTLLANLQQPGLHLLGEKDTLVPASALHALQELNPRHEYVLLSGAAHAIHWSQPQRVMNHVIHFLQRLEQSHKDNLCARGFPDKKKIAQSFSRAAPTYDQVAGLQRYVSQTLLAKVSVQQTHVVLDLGSGTGVVAAHLANQAAQVIALDIAEGMLTFAKARYHQSVGWLCGDAENLPLADASVDIIFSSLAIQWCNHLPSLMKEINRVLKPGGQVYISTLGPQTLHELKTAWQQVDDYVHVNQFASEIQLEQALDRAGLQLESIECDKQVLHFDSLSDLTHSLKALGAHNMNPGQAAGLTGRKHLLMFKAAYEQYRTAAGLPLTYEVFYLVINKAVSAH